VKKRDLLCKNAWRNFNTVSAVVQHHVEGESAIKMQGHLLENALKRFVVEANFL